MTELIFPCLMIFVWLYHLIIRRIVRREKIREGYCALWVGDLFLTLFGMIITCSVYHFTLLPFFTLRNLLTMILVSLLSLALLVLAPSGLDIFTPQSKTSTEELIIAEYRFNETMGIVRNLFLILLFLLPMFLSLENYFPECFAFLEHFGEGEICSTFCLIAFSILLPICLRQSLFWMRKVTRIPGETENKLLKLEKAKNHYKTRNLRM